MKETFQGFPRGTPRFLGQLSKNNNRPWFEKNKARFTCSFKEPAETFARALSEAMRKTFPDLDPLAVKIFQVHRDIRFSRDKTPYKTHIGIRLSGEPGQGCGAPFFYVQIEAEALRLVTGIKALEGKTAVRYRQAMSDAGRGQALARVIAGLAKRGLDPQGEKYKRMPPGVDAAGPAAELAKYKGLYVVETLPLPADFHTPRLPEFCARRFKPAKPLYDWLSRLSHFSPTRLRERD
jgi:uncharacterized protein (TIGR02453 family)